MFKAMTIPDRSTGKPVSLSVPIVQELALQDPHAVPEKYVASEQDRPSLLFSTGESDSIPVIDMSILHDNPKELEKIALAAQEWGFFQVVNHGIPGSLMERMRSVVKGFFQLPLEEKLKCEMQNNQGYGQAFVASEEQRLDWADILFLFTLPVESRDMNLWPTTPANFRETMQDYALETKILAEKLLTVLAQGLGIRSDCFVESFGELYGSVRMNYYPPCPRPELVLGLSPHSDAVGITILLQDDKCLWEALQVRKGGEWVSIPFIPDALVINIGDHLEVMFRVVDLKRHVEVLKKVCEGLIPNVKGLKADSLEDLEPEANSLEAEAVFYDSEIFHDETLRIFLKKLIEFLINIEECLNKNEEEMGREMQNFERWKRQLQSWESELEQWIKGMKLYFCLRSYREEPEILDRRERKRNPRLFNRKIQDIVAIIRQRLASILDAVYSEFSRSNGHLKVELP